MSQGTMLSEIRVPVQLVRMGLERTAVVTILSALAQFEITADNPREQLFFHITDLPFFVHQLGIGTGQDFQNGQTLFLFDDCRYVAFFEQLRYRIDSFLQRTALDPFFIGGRQPFRYARDDLSTNAIIG
jgi:hypothetical protein